MKYAENTSIGTGSIIDELLTKYYISHLFPFILFVYKISNKNKHNWKPLIKYTSIHVTTVINISYSISLISILFPIKQVMLQ